MGSREVTEKNFPHAALQIKRICERCTGIILSGGARGADSLAEEGARYFRKPFKKMPVEDFEWDLLGKRAGIMRNEHMALYLKQYGGFAFIFIVETSRGAKNMIEQCERYEVPHKVIQVA
jgi:hypothetical protein